MQVKKLITLAILAAAGAVPFTANADTSSSTFQVKLQIISSCTVTASGANINFGIHTGTAAANYTDGGTSNLSVTCDSGVPYNIGLLGTATGATANGTGNMVSGSNSIAYTLWQNAGRTTVWGNTIGTNTLSGTGAGATAQSIPVYAKATTVAGQAVGTYTDTVNVTLTY